MTNVNIAALFAVWIIVALALYRTQRVVTADEWPPSEWLRGSIKESQGEDSSWYKFITCPWCFGFWATVLLGALTHFHVVSLVTGQFHRAYLFPAYVIVAMSAVVGLIGSRD